ncbi:MAG TPA: ATP-binding cassette domain-containing protein, partial [Gaiellales bacterium]|nr:ATP-binding cassette domain-containing protein [Gaiellales bacterium]
MLDVKGLQARYGKSQVLHNVDLRVDAGETVCLLGRNGVGKSTTLKTIMGLVRLAGGEIQYRDRPIGGERPHRIARLGIGFVPEERRIFPTITVGQN